MQQFVSFIEEWLPLRTLAVWHSRNFFFCLAQLILLVIIDTCDVHFDNKLWMEEEKTLGKHMDTRHLNRSLI